MADLLIEILSEEIPARMQKRAISDFEKLVSDGIAEAGLSYGDKKGFVTPRRLTLMISDLPEKSLAKTEERKGPRVDAPDKAIEGFIRATGLSKQDLQIRDVKGQATYFAKITTPGRSAKDVIAEILTQTIQNFPWPKSMRWGTHALRWVRPIHSIIALLSDEDNYEIVPVDIEGIKAGNMTRGHRFLAPDEIVVNSTQDYLDKLAAAKVVLDPEARIQKIKTDAENAAFALGLELVEDTKLLHEAAGLVEYPVVYLGEIEKQFLDLPPEVLQTSMAEHQKFLSLKNKTGSIVGYVIVANRTTTDNGEMIKHGNAKVLRARLADAVFFWENDKREISLNGFETWLEKLESVTFHNKIGTQRARIKRLEEIAREIAPLVNADANHAARAAKIAKTDLASEMVYEFPELQGIMGTYYANIALEKANVAEACTTHYAPLGPSDDVPTEPVAIAVALADKIDMLTGFWAIDEKPTGSKDPFALRRAALGVIRILLENNVDARLLSLLEKGNPEANSSDLLSFIYDRLNVYLRDQDIRHDVIDALKNRDGSDHLARLVRQIKSLDNFLKTDDGTNMQTGIKRALNILSSEEKKDGVSYELEPDSKLMKSEEEIKLHHALISASQEIESALDQNEFETAMNSIGELRSEVDVFFENVTVNDDNQIIRRNRLCLLNQIRILSHLICDFEKLEG